MAIYTKTEEKVRELIREAISIGWKNAGGVSVKGGINNLMGKHMHLINTHIDDSHVQCDYKRCEHIWIPSIKKSKRFVPKYGHESATNEYEVIDSIERLEEVICQKCLERKSLE